MTTDKTTPTIYTTLDDLRDQAIVPTLNNGVEPTFDVDAFISDLRDADLIIYDEDRRGFYLADRGEPGRLDDPFWWLVEKHDLAAIAARIR